MKEVGTGDHNRSLTFTRAHAYASRFYDYLPWARDGVAVANEPWSGHYEITSPTWALAHTSQFAKPGWRYVLEVAFAGVIS